MGPVEYLIMAFPDSTSFDFAIGPAMQALVDKDVIAVLDMVFVAKDADGGIATLEADEASGLASLTVIDGDVGGLISEDDIDYVADALLPNSCALTFVVEDRWANPLAEILRASGGVLLEGARVSPELVDATIAELEIVA